ncbi:zinc ABC transporter substrate-binding protein [Oleiphilus sp. HI0125]|uniref:zinc ABC transporter substrate-binding protein n=2 Tax=unclassified Oleiphilus TaxID=2631174 RepID=UPI0008382FFC|nr:zinc ABC transporter substrate-binding protein [Oleiphilus sp. HI0125]
MLKKNRLALMTSLLPLTAFADAPSIAVDIAPLHSIVSQVTAGVTEPNLIIPAEASPHYYSLKPSQARSLANSDVVFWMGEELTPWLEKSMDNVAESAKKVEILELDETITYAFREGATFEGHDHGDHDEHGHDDHDDHGHDKHDDHGHDDHDDHGHDKHDDHGHDKHDDHGHDKHDDHGHDDHGHDEHEGHHHAHDGVDPHAWLDPVNAKNWVTVIKDTLSKMDAENADKYEANAEKAIAGLDELIANAQAQISELGEPKFVVFHDAYQYFEKRFNVPATGSITLGDAEAPSPARIKEIKDKVTELNVTCVFAEPQFDSGLVSNVFEGSVVTTIGIMDPLGSAIEEGPGHYNALIEGMVKSLSECK